MSNSKVILIAGGSVGIGLESANQLCDKGHKIYVFARRKEKPEAFRNGIEYRSIDVTDNDSIRNYVNYIADSNNNKIDVLINSTALTMAGAVEDLTEDELKKIFNVNVFGYIRTMKTVLPYMREQRRGKIINIGSLAGLLAYPFQTSYCMSKYAIEGLCESMAFEVGMFGIDIVLVEPGDIATDIHKRRLYSQNTNEGSPYYKVLKPSIEEASEREMEGLPVSKAGKVISKIVDSKKVKRRYKIGADAKLIPLLKKILPYRVYEFILSKTFNIPKKI